MRLRDIKPGMQLEAIGDYADCIVAGDRYVVGKDSSGELYINCRDGHHALGAHMAQRQPWWRGWAWEIPELRVWQWQMDDRAQPPMPSNHDRLQTALHIAGEINGAEVVNLNQRRIARYWDEASGIDRGVKRLTFDDGRWWDVQQIGGAIVNASPDDMHLVELGHRVLWWTVEVGNRPEIDRWVATRVLVSIEPRPVVLAS